MSKYIIIFLLFARCTFVIGQNAKQEAQNVVLFPIQFGYHFPMGDLADRFGNSSTIGLGYLSQRHNGFTFGIEGHYIFGNTINEPNYLENIVNDNGTITDLNGFPADVDFSERGFLGYALIGKLIRNEKNPYSGWRVLLGLGFMNHKIHFLDRNNSVIQFQGDARLGYDRLTGGFASKIELGYQYLSPSRRINCYAAVEAHLGFTKGLQIYNFDTDSYPSENRNDILLGIKVGWILPIYKSSTDQYFYD